MQDDLFYQEEYKKLKKMEQAVLQYSAVYFYGAGLRSEEILQMQKEGFHFLRRPDAFIVSSRKNDTVENAEQLDGIPVYCIDDMKEFPEDSAIVVIAMDIYHDEIKIRLSYSTCSNIYYLTDAMEQLLTREFLNQYFSKCGMSAVFLPFVSHYSINKELYQKRIHTYSVMCEKDEKTTTCFQHVDWISDIQAGALTAKKKIADIGDDTGENISLMNSYYNELTGLYWVWKNTAYEFSGICHYRRRFESEIALLPLIKNEADVVLPLPFVVGNNLRIYYQHWGESSYYEVMLKVIEKKYPDYYETACSCVSHPVFFPNNICIARKDVLDEYCSFLFDVIFSVENEMTGRRGKKQKRCWLSEHVSTIYFMHHMNDYRMYFSKIKRCW